MGEWEVEARCSAMAPDTADAIFYPNGLDSVDEASRRQAAEPAKRVCGTCPVITTCQKLVAELESGEKTSRRHGIWAGLTPRERTQLDPLAPRKKRKDQDS